MTAKKGKKVRVFLARGYWPLDSEWEDLEKEDVSRVNHGGKLKPGEEGPSGMLMESAHANTLYNAGVIKLENPFDDSEDEE